MGAGLGGVGGWTGDSAWGMGRSGGWVRGGFHWAVVLVDLSMGLRSARVGLVGWGEGRGGVAQSLWVSSRALHCGKEELGTMTGVLNISQRH